MTEMSAAQFYSEGGPLDVLLVVTRGRERRMKVQTAALAGQRIILEDTHSNSVQLAFEDRVTLLAKGRP